MQCKRLHSGAYKANLYSYKTHGLRTIVKNLSFDSSRWTLFNNLLVVGFALWGFAMQNYKKDEASFFQRVIIEFMAPLQKGTVSIKDQVAYTFDHYVDIVNTSKENVELKKKVETLENTIFQLNELERENERLKQLLEFGKDIPRKKVLAQVVSWDASNEFKVLRINKGANDGLSLLAPVITMTGLVGYVYRVSGNYSDILTILDQNNRVDSIVARTRTHGIVEGFSDFKCQLKYVPRTEQLEIGDEVITAGLGEIYPKGIKVGKISKIDKENFGITQRIVLEPSVNFQKLEEVVVLIEDNEKVSATETDINEQREER